jgi:hypothetical protein
MTRGRGIHHDQAVRIRLDGVDDIDHRRELIDPGGARSIRL